MRKNHKERRHRGHLALSRETLHQLSSPELTRVAAGRENREQASYTCVVYTCASWPPP
jgi:hypothetical protein